MILGTPWLRDHNPRINWQENAIELINWEKERGHSLQSITQIIKVIIIPKKETKLNRVLMGSTGICKKGIIDEEDYLADFLNEEEIKSWIQIKQITKYLEREEDVQTLGEDCTWVCIKQSASQRFAQSAEEGKEKKVASLPEEFSEFSSVFSKKESEQLPDHHPWDCKIEEKPDFQRKVVQAYPIPPALMEMFHKWL